MFCPPNETLQQLTEKTKLLAQKCTQQKRVNATDQLNTSSSTSSSLDLSGRQQQVATFKSYISEVESETNPEKIDLPSSQPTPLSYLTVNLASLNRIFKNRCSFINSPTSYHCNTFPRKRAKKATAKWFIKPTWRLWGEERDKDAIYTVYLKKVRYHRPTPSYTNTQNDSDDEISHLEWETVRVRFVKAATLDRLVDALVTDDGELESTFVNVFLATYRTFTKTEKVLELLLQKFENLRNSEQYKKTLISVLHLWLDGYSDDWDGDNLQTLLTFTSSRLPNSKLHMKALNKFTARLDKYSRVPPLSWNDPMMTSYQDMTDHFNGMCLSPAFRGTPNSHLLSTYRFPNISVKHFAEQLTRMDMELFKRLIPHQCLGETWSHRDKIECGSVLATVLQFNAVSYRVISTILIEPKLKPQERALLISTWVDIGQELRLLKNFSSLKAIISGLQSNSVYRLSKTWAALCKEKFELFNELARIFSEENNASAQRAVLWREGTAKFADTVGENDRHLQKVFQKQNTFISHGTIPYLGTFLTDLTMIHAAIPDKTSDNLINFDKKRKEFEVLAQIKLLQGAANSYHLPEDLLFDRWFASLLVLDEKEAHNISCQIEAPPANQIHLNQLYVETKKSGGHHKSDSITSNSSSGVGSHFFCDINNISYSSRNNSLDRGMTPPLNSSILSAASSVSSLSMESTTSGSQNHSNSKTPSKTPSKSSNNHELPPHINAQLQPNSPLLKANGTNVAPDFYIIKVTCENDSAEVDGILYKSIMLSNNERTPQVIRNAMMKLGLEGDPDKFTLSQILPDKELMLPTNANVYYAVNTQFNLNFILRRKKDVLVIS
ncbi:CLUMA_CG007172, isoform A [Clunio marinus]|uniref:CLUMA_CG007172, isoform A n=1 Tax=Clunio marinus TaxID=568069 RepID=A0A1J1I0C4_9DIPT|nr:CLUMA_CG007172, isoform A [Clunio marinus]